MTTGKTTTLTIWTFVGKVMSLLFNMLSRIVIAFLPNSMCLNFMAAVTICKDFGAKKIKSVTISIVCPSICHEMMGLNAMILGFWMLSFKPAFPLSSFTFINRLFSSSWLFSLVPLCFLPWEWCHLHIWGYWSLPRILIPACDLAKYIHFTWCTLHIS